MNYMTSPDSKAIQAHGLTKNFGRKQALAGLSFSVPNGSVAGFLGPNGAGKTTTLRLILGLAYSDSGDMEMLGLSMPRERRQVLEQTGALVEHPSFIDGFSGFDNLYWFGSLFRPTSTERINEFLQLVGLSDSANRNFGVYSTGMKQRLGVGAAILHRPSLLILDEPTNGMDPQGRAQMRDVLKEIHSKENTTIFLSSHLIDEIQRLCDYVVIVDKGRTVKEGRVADILMDEKEAWEIRVTGQSLGDVKEALSGLPQVLSSEIGPRGLVVVLKPDSSVEINRFLVGKGFSISALIPREASLEETFLAVTKSNGN